MNESLAGQVYISLMCQKGLSLMDSIVCFFGGLRRMMVHVVVSRLYEKKCKGRIYIAKREGFGFRILDE